MKFDNFIYQNFILVINWEVKKAGYMLEEKSRNSGLSFRLARNPGMKRVKRKEKGVSRRRRKIETFFRHDSSVVGHVHTLCWRRRKKQGRELNNIDRLLYYIYQQFSFSPTLNPYYIYTPPHIYLPSKIYSGLKYSNCGRNRI